MTHGEGGIHLHGGERHRQDPPGLPHGICGIDAEIHQDLVHGGWVGKDRPCVFGNVLANRNRRGERGPQQLEGLFDHLVEVEGRALLVACPAEGQNLLHQLFGAFFRREDVL
jgi:hypothetical protein